jgi:hypothetical protein
MHNVSNQWLYVYLIRFLLIGSSIIGQMYLYSCIKKEKNIFYFYTF